MGDFDFACEYAKSSRSTCKGSGKKIPQGALRMAKMVQAPNFDGKIPHWYLFEEFFKKGTMGLVSEDEIKGFDQLKNDDQEKIRAKLGRGDGGAPAKPKGRGKRKKADTDSDDDDDDGSDGESQKKKHKSKEDEAWAKENEFLWELKEKVDKNLTPAEMKEMLENNDLKATGGRQDLVQRIADALAYGLGPKCDSADCTADTRMFFSYSERKWKCPVKLQWGTCLNTKELDEVKTTKPTWPDDLDFKYKARKRVLRAVKETTAEDKKKRLLASMVVVLLSPDPALEKQISEHGGVVKGRVTKDITHLIAREDEYDASSKGKIATALKYSIPVIPPSFIEKTIEAGMFLDENKCRLDPDAPTSSSTAPTKITTDEETKKKRIVKNGYAVDPECGLNLMEVSVHRSNKGDGYDVMLNLADVITNKNSYYALQVIKHDSKKDVWLWRKWGRVATDIGGNKLEKCASVDDAITLFESLYEEKTGNDWNETGPKNKRKNFVKQPKKMVPIDISYSEEDNKSSIKRDISSTGSKLHPKVQDLIKLIFDINIMETQLLEMQFDLKKMPLGNLTKDHIKKGYDVLTEISDVLTEARSVSNRDQTLLQLTNQFYSIIPHDFGLSSPQMITSLEVLKNKIKMMEALMDIEIATSILKSSDSGAKSEIDQKYDALKTKLEPIEHDSDEFKLIEEYITNTRVAGSNNWPKLTVSEVFTVEREGEEKRYQKAKKDIGNRFMLFHGSRISNYGGILSEGLRIAPPSAPKSGYRFGKGVYFADVIAKSAHYCRSAGSDYMLIMLCDVSMGKMWETTKDKYMEKPQPGFDSTKAMGQYQPTVDKTMDNGKVQLPCGKPKDTKIDSWCDVNEYIVYDIGQVNIRYLMKLHHPSK